jgi:hypothetical protein
MTGLIGLLLLRTKPRADLLPAPRRAAACVLVAPFAGPTSEPALRPDPAIARLVWSVRGPGSPAAAGNLVSVVACVTEPDDRVVLERLCLCLSAPSSVDPVSGGVRSGMLKIGKLEGVPPAEWLTPCVGVEVRKAMDPVI